MSDGAADLAKLIGITGPEFELPIERGKIREFALALGATDPAYIEDPKPLAPPTLLTIATHIWGYSLEQPRGSVFGELKIDASLLLHAEEEYEFFGETLRAGEILRGRTSIAEAYDKIGRRGTKLTFYVFETQFLGALGALRARSRTTVVQTTEPAQPQ
jgi:hypothetical protein